MTIIADEKEFQEDFSTLVEMALYHSVMIKREDGTMLSLSKVEDSNNNSTEVSE